MIFAGKFTQFGDPGTVSETLKKERNGKVEIYAITVGEDNHSSGFGVMKNISSDIEGQQHFFWLDSNDNFDNIIKEMISPGNYVVVFLLTLSFKSSWVKSSESKIYALFENEGAKLLFCSLISVRR